MTFPQKTAQNEQNMPGKMLKHVSPSLQRVEVKFFFLEIAYFYLQETQMADLTRNIVTKTYSVFRVSSLSSSYISIKANFS